MSSLFPHFGLGNLQEGKIYEDLYIYPPPEASEKGYNEVRVGGW